MEEKQKALDRAILQIEKQYGKGSIMRLGEQTSLDLEVIPTGSLSLDIALGVGAFPGPDRGDLRARGFRKTTLALHVMAEVQKTGASRPWWMRNTPWIPATPGKWGRHR